MELKQKIDMASRLLRLDCYLTTLHLPSKGLDGFIPEEHKSYYKQYQFAAFIEIERIIRLPEYGSMSVWYNTRQIKTLTRSAKQIAGIFGLEAVVSRTYGIDPVLIFIGLNEKKAKLGN